MVIPYFKAIRKGSMAGIQDSGKGMVSQKKGLPHR